MSKGDFPFAAAARVSSLMEEFEWSVLARYTPCIFKERADVNRALAETHVELFLIRRQTGTYPGFAAHRKSGGTSVL